MNQNEIVAALSAAIGAEQVLHDDTSRAHFSHDLFHSGLPPACVVVPRTPEDVVDAVRVATTAGHPVVPRGGGMSYTGGYVANDDKAVMFDLRRLDRVLEIDEVNRACAPARLVT